MPELSDANLLLDAFNSAAKTSKWKANTQRAEHNRLSIIAKLHNELETGTYQSGELTKFITSERGKTRLISGNTIEDRTVRHALCDNILLPAVKQRVIYDNSASQVGKGVHFARERLKMHLHKFYRHFGSDGYILVIDFSKYYDNILHEKAYDQLSEFVEDKEQEYVLKNIFDNYKVDVSYMSDDEYAEALDGIFSSLEFLDIPDDSKTGEKYLPKSIPIGDQTSQVIGIYYPHELDNYCKIVLGLKYYGRYMDDLYVIHQDKNYLHQVHSEIEKQSALLGLHTNQKKSQIFRIDRPFHFLQNTYYLTESGRVVEKINKKRLAVMRAKLRKLSVMVANGERDRENIENMFRSWIGAHKSIMSHKQIENMYSLFHELFDQERIKKGSTNE